MSGSWKIARIRGIDIFVHWTFTLLILWMVVAYLMQGATTLQIVYGIFFVLAVFGCVVLHELGHSLAAARYGIGTKHITLLPIGGVASLQRMPREPRHELFIALAGPAVNVVIAAILFAYLAITSRPGLFPTDMELPDRMVGGPILVNLFVVNVMLVVFNLIPAFPMDGGRILRALLATNMSYPQATSIAAKTGQVLAVALGVLGLMGNPLLVLVAVFVFLGAAGENRMVQLAEAMHGLLVKDAMMKRFRTLSPDDSLQRAADELLLGNQRDFPVVVSDEVVGIVRQLSIIRGIRENGLQASIRTVTEPVSQVAPGDPLDKASERLGEHRGEPCVVVDGFGRLVGMLSTENLGELLMIRSALHLNALPQPKRLGQPMSEGQSAT